MTRPEKCPHCERELEPADKAPRSSIAIDSQGDVGRSARRGRMTSRGLLVRLIGVAIVGVVTVAVSFLLTRRDGSGDSLPAKPGASRPRQQSIELVGLPPDQMLESLEFAVVKIESTDFDRGTSLGSGFVIDKSGLIATSYHVVSQATTAQVRFQDGSAYDVAGYAAVDPANDLAIVKLADSPRNMKVMSLSDAGDVPKLSAVIAIGHPHGIEFSPYDGRVSRVIRSSQLPASSQEFLRRALSLKQDQRWIQHTARIAEGNSGGPLIDASGRVIGVNTWVDDSTHFGYALHVEHLADLQSRTSSELQPLAEHARRETKVARLLQELSADKINELYAQAEAFRFQPRDEQQYDVLSQLAWVITAANLPGSFAPSGVLEKQLDELAEATDAIVAKLSSRRWDGPGQITVLNEFAGQRIDRPLHGLVMVATITRIVQSQQGARGALLQLSGVERSFFVPLDGVLFSPEPGEAFLVLGVNYNGGVVRYGDNPLQLTRAPLIASRTFIPLDSRP